MKPAVLCTGQQYCHTVKLRRSRRYIRNEHYTLHDAPSCNDDLGGAGVLAQERPHTIQGFFLLPPIPKINSSDF